MKKLILTSISSLVLIFASVTAFANTHITNLTMVKKLDQLSSKANLLFVQTAKRAEVTDVAGNSGKLVLHVDTPYVSYFTDEPYRVAGLLPIKDFINNWNSSSQHKEFVPNAAFITVDSGAKPTNEYFKLVGAPTYIPSKSEVIYKIEPINHKSKLVNQNLGFTVLFIDAFTWHCMTC